MLSLKCQCCGFTREFEDPTTAAEAGWDCPPQFSGPITCELCPTEILIVGCSHGKAHARWKERGRPERYSIAECGADHEIDDPIAQQQFEEELHLLIES